MKHSARFAYGTRDDCVHLYFALISISSLHMWFGGVFVCKCNSICSNDCFLSYKNELNWIAVSSVGLCCSGTIAHR